MTNNNQSKKVKSTVEKSPLNAWAVINTAIFAKLYLAFSLLVVLVTTIYWSLLSAKVQLSNSDQLVNADLFQNLKTFRDATFPEAHTFLLKWPIFLLIRLFGSTSSTINTVTVGIVLLTVGALLFFIYRIERRPLVFGTICLALASVLVMIPAAPYAGALLPLNMAMLATRNIEYIVFILSLVLFLRSSRIRSWGFCVAAILLSLLIASDKLFLGLTIGGALLALIVYALTKAWGLVSITVRWLILGVVAAIGSSVILTVITSSRLTHLAGQSNPYALASSLKNIILGVIYAISGVLSNFGANPAFDATEIKHMPHQFFSRLFSVSGPAYIVNFIILVIGLYVVYKVIRSSWTTYKPRKVFHLDKGMVLSVALIWASVAALISFVVTNHYYAVDARYLTIVLFAVFISFATYSRTKTWSPNAMVRVGLVLTLSIALGLIGATHIYKNEQNALAPTNNSNKTIALVLAQHHEDVLVGDYWRVIPIKQDDSRLNVMPLSNCTEARQALTSTDWQPDLSHTGFAYLLTIKGSLTDYPNCSLKLVVDAYGKPNASALIAGSLSNPSQVLLFYDQGTSNASRAATRPQGPATVLPLPISQLTNTTCSGPSVTNIVAHQDDDLLFMNPDLYNEVKAGDCIRSIYLTAGDDGLGQFYWLSREQGSEAAYSYMLGSNAIWIQKIVELNNHEYVTIASPRGNPKISLIFMHLPDGNLKGQGFSSSGYQSLAKLASHNINIINSVDKQSYYTASQLVSALSTLMNVYQTTQINTQAGVAGTEFPDHSDHLTVNLFVKQAYKQFETQKYDNQVVIPIKYYIGYPVHQMSPNITGAVLAEKEAIFLRYAKHDGSVCQSIQVCQQTPTYEAYLTREYQSSY